MIESIAFDLLPLLEQERGVRLIKGTSPNQYVFRMNWLHPPFNNPMTLPAPAPVTVFWGMTKNYAHAPQAQNTAGRCSC